MKILTIAVQTKGHGAYARQRRMAHALVTSGHEILWMAPGIDLPGKEQLIQVQPLWLPLPRPIIWQIRLLRTFHKFRDELADVDLIYTVREYDALACKLSRLLREKPHVLFQRGDVIECEKFNYKYPLRLRDKIVRPLTLAIYIPLQRWLFPRLTVTVFLAEFLVSLAKARLKKTEFPMAILPNDCKIKWVHEEEERDGEQRIKSVRMAGVPLIGMVAPLYWHGKGVGIFLEAMRLLSKTCPFRAAIVGYGPNELDIQRFIEDTGLSEVVFFLGRIKGAYQYMNLFDLMVVPTMMVDACPNVVLEAMAKDVPIVASDIAAHRNLLMDEELLFRNADSAALAVKVQNLLESPELLARNKQLVSIQRRRFDFDWDGELVELIERVANNG